MKLYKNGKGQFCGKLSDDLIYRKEVDSTKHKMHIMDGYGIDRYIIDDLRSMDCIEIRIRENDTGKILTINFLDFLEHSVLRNIQGEQYFVSVRYFDEVNYKKTVV